MTALDLDAIRERWQAATPGPWRLQTAATFDDTHDDTHSAVKAGGHLVCDDCPNDDALAIAAAPNDVPALLAEVERLPRIEAAAREYFEPWAGRWTPREIQAGLLRRQRALRDNATEPRS